MASGQTGQDGDHDDVEGDKHERKENIGPPGNHAVVKKHAYQARQEDVTAHTLHHNFAKNLVDASTPLDQVAVLLGDWSLDTTRIYMQPEDQSED